MAVEYGTPQFFVTFTGASAPDLVTSPSSAHIPDTSLPCTANEGGWSDLRAACDGEHHSKCPVEATRAYNRRWEAFLKTYLHGSSPIGKISRVWWRQEDQARPVPL